MLTEEEITQREKELNDQLAAMPRKKWKLLRSLPGFIIFPFVAPYTIRDRKHTMQLTSEANYTVAVTAFAAGSFIVTALLCYLHIRKVNYAIYSIKFDLELLRNEGISIHDTNEYTENLE